MASPQTYLPDTNILIHMVRQSPLYQQVAAQYPLAPTDPRPVLSIVIVGEILSFAKRNNWGQTKRKILDDFLLRCEIISLDAPGLVEAYVELEYNSYTKGRAVGDNDLWIAATARVENATLLTTDKDFDHLSPSYIQRVWIDPMTQ